MKRMGDFLNRINLGQITIIAFLAGMMDWLVTNEIVFWMTFITISITALLALRKGLIHLRNDIKFLLDFLKRKWK